MNVIPAEIPDILILEPEIFGDERGYFLESWNEADFRTAGINCRWVQDNESKSRAGVVRGLHWQAAPYTQAKLVRVISGAVLDVAVDIREGSATFGKYTTVELNDKNKRQLFIPSGFAHGFAVLSDEVIFTYKCDNPYMPSAECGIAFDDPDLNIDWHIAPEKMILSPKDRDLPYLRDIAPWEEK